MSLKDKLNIQLDESEEKTVNLASKVEKKEELTMIIRNFINKELDFCETLEEVNHILNI